MVARNRTEKRILGCLSEATRATGGTWGATGRTLNRLQARDRRYVDRRLERPAGSPSNGERDRTYVDNPTSRSTPQPPGATGRSAATQPALRRWSIAKALEMPPPRDRTYVPHTRTRNGPRPWHHAFQDLARPPTQQESLSVCPALPVRRSREPDGSLSPETPSGRACGAGCAVALV